MDYIEKIILLDPTAWIPLLDFCILSYALPTIVLLRNLIESYFQDCLKLKSIHSEIYVSN